MNTEYYYYKARRIIKMQIFLLTKSAVDARRVEISEHTRVASRSAPVASDVIVVTGAVVSACDKVKCTDIF